MAGLDVWVVDLPSDAGGRGEFHSGFPESRTRT